MMSANTFANPFVELPQAHENIVLCCASLPTTKLASQAVSASSRTAAPQCRFDCRLRDRSAPCDYNILSADICLAAAYRQQRILVAAYLSICTGILQQVRDTGCVWLWPRHWTVLSVMREFNTASDCDQVVLVVQLRLYWCYSCKARLTHSCIEFHRTYY